MRGGSTKYVTTIHLFSGDTINQNKLGWERENRLPTPREAARRSRSLKFLRSRVRMSCPARTRTHTDAPNASRYIRMQDNARICVSIRVSRIIRVCVCVGHELGCCAARLGSRVGRLMLYWRIPAPLTRSSLSQRTL